MLVRRKHHEEPTRPQLLRIALVGADIDVAKELAQWVVARTEDGTARDLCPTDDASPHAPLEVHMTIQASPKERELAASCAVAAEMILLHAPCAACMHLAEAGHSALLHAAIVIDARGGDAAARAARRDDLAMDMAFLCPEAALVMHQNGASLSDELDRAR